MTEQELQTIRRKWQALSASTEWRDAGDVIALLRAIDERDAIIHDLMLDGQHTAKLAVAQFIAEMSRWVVAEKDKHNTDDPADFGAAAALGCVLAQLAARSSFNGAMSVSDPLPPEQARAEAARLRDILANLTNGCGSHFCQVRAPTQTERGTHDSCRCVAKLASVYLMDWLIPSMNRLVPGTETV